MQYLCSKCGAKCTQNRRDKVAPKNLGAGKFEADTGISLGTFRCPFHGKVAVKRSKD